MLPQQKCFRQQGRRLRMPAPTMRAVLMRVSFVDLVAAMPQKMLWSPLKWRSDKGHPRNGHCRGCRQTLADFSQPRQVDCKQGSYLCAAGQNSSPAPSYPTPQTVYAHCWLHRHCACPACGGVLVQLFLIYHHQTEISFCCQRCQMESCIWHQFQVPFLS